VQDQLDRGVVCPVQVVQQQDDGLLAAEELEQAAQRAVIAKALGRAGAGGGLRRAAGSRGGKHRAEVAAERGHAAGVHRRDVVVEGVDYHSEGNVALVLGGPRP